MFAAIDTGLMGCTPPIKTTSFRSFQTGNARNVASETHIQWADRNEATDFSILVTSFFCHSKWKDGPHGSEVDRWGQYITSIHSLCPSTLSCRVHYWTDTYLYGVVEWFCVLCGTIAVWLTSLLQSFIATFVEFFFNHALLFCIHLKSFGILPLPTVNQFCFRFESEIPAKFWALMLWVKWHSIALLEIQIRSRLGQVKFFLNDKKLRGHSDFV